MIFPGREVVVITPPDAEPWVVDLCTDLAFDLTWLAGRLDADGPAPDELTDDAQGAP